MAEHELRFEPATRGDLRRLQAIRAAAFEPVFASFRALLGDTIYETAQAHEDAGQAGLLEAMFEPDSIWEVHVVRRGEIIEKFP